MILADENIHNYIITELRRAGIKILSVREQAQGISDQEVIEWAQNEKLVNLTEDKDFGEWVFAHHVTGISVIFLRYVFSEFHQITATLLNFLQAQPLSHPVFVTLTINKIHIRQL